MMRVVPFLLPRTLKCALPAVAAILGIVAWQLERDACRSSPAPLETPRSDSVHVDREILRIEQVLRIPDSAQRSRRESTLAAAVEEEDIPAILERLSDSRRTSLYACILAGRWAARDPAAAATWIDARQGTKSHAGLLAKIAGAWAELDGDAATAWARGMADRHRATALAEISTVLVSRDPHVALALAEESGRDSAVRDCLLDWARQDPAEAAQRVLSISNGRTEMLIDVVSEWARQDPAAAGGFVVSSMPRDERMDHAILAVIARAGAADLPMLRDWVAAFPDGPLKESSRAELTRIERLLPSSPASLPGEDDEDRTPVAVSPNPKIKP